MLTPPELAGGFGLPDSAAVASRIEESFYRQFRSLPDDTQRLLLTAAAEPIGDMKILRRAAELQGIGAGAAAPAEVAGLVELGANVRFRRPLVRSAVYQHASLNDRQTVHQAPAEATDRAIDPHRRAWHVAQAAREPDAAVTDELELGRPGACSRRRGRGGRVPGTSDRAHARSCAPGSPCDRERDRERDRVAARQVRLVAPFTGQPVTPTSFTQRLGRS